MSRRSSCIDLETGTCLRYLKFGASKHVLLQISLIIWLSSFLRSRARTSGSRVSISCDIRAKFNSLDHPASDNGPQAPSKFTGFVWSKGICLGRSIHTRRRPSYTISFLEFTRFCKCNPKTIGACFYSVTLACHFFMHVSEIVGLRVGNLTLGKAHKNRSIRPRAEMAHLS